MKISIISGSPRKGGNGKLFIDKVAEELYLQGDVEVEKILLVNSSIEMCLGCQLCYVKGEKYCPINDDIMSLRKKIEESEGVIFYSPTYIVNISGLMKNFFDRLSYICHRPMFYGKTAMFITTAGSSGGRSALKCMKWPVLAWGFSAKYMLNIKMSHYENDEIYKEKIDKDLAYTAKKFYGDLKLNHALKPSVFDIVGFNIRKKHYKKRKDCYDKRYWEEKGWLDNKAQFYFPINVGFFRKTMTAIISKILSRIM